MPSHQNHSIPSAQQDQFLRIFDQRPTTNDQRLPPYYASTSDETKASTPASG